MGSVNEESRQAREGSRKSDHEGPARSSFSLSGSSGTRPGSSNVLARTDAGGHDVAHARARSQRKASQVGQDARLAHLLENSRRGCKADTAKRPGLATARDSLGRLEAYARESGRGGRNAGATSAAAGAAALLQQSVNSGARGSLKGLQQQQQQQQAGAGVRSSVLAHSLLAAAAARSAATNAHGVHTHELGLLHGHDLARHRNQHPHQGQGQGYEAADDEDDGFDGSLNTDEVTERGAAAAAAAAAAQSVPSMQIYTGKQTASSFKYPPPAYRF